nr:hypothetical protein [uncultured Methanobrevibacter sp.]
MNINKNNFSLVDTVKFTVIALIGSLIIGFVLYYLTQFSIYQYSLYANPGLTVFAFPVAVILSVIILAANMKNRNDAIVMGLVVGILTGLLQSPVISLFMGKMSGAWFDTYIGSQVFLLIILGIAAAYFGNAYLKQRINH